MIVASAIRLENGSVYVGKRHSDCFRNIIEINTKAGTSYDDSRKFHFNCEQGFLTDSLMFLTRSEAYNEARKYGQCKEIFSDTDNIELLSENLW